MQIPLSLCALMKAVQQKNIYKKKTSYMNNLTNSFSLLNYILLWSIDGLPTALQSGSVSLSAHLDFPLLCTCMLAFSLNFSEPAIYMEVKSYSNLSI